MSDLLEPCEAKVSRNWRTSTRHDGAAGSWHPQVALHRAGWSTIDSNCDEIFDYALAGFAQDEASFPLTAILYQPLTLS